MNTLVIQALLRFKKGKVVTQLNITSTNKENRVVLIKTTRFLIVCQSDLSVSC